MTDTAPESKSSILKSIHSPADIRTLSIGELASLTAEIRSEIIRTITVNGGHLASSLGAVELIVSLHYVFNTPYDQIIFDVGHQTYAHKILTGRLDRFPSIRLAGGLSGFPRREESQFDVFDTGHASTSISAALGLASARDLSQEKNRSVVAVIGDGALTGGLAMEAMNHAGGLQKNLLIILNDNRMSISPNVGAISQYLSLKLSSPEHVHLREWVKEGLTKIMPQKGNRFIRRFQMAEESIKNFLISPNSFLAAWGFKYLGPIDGHDLVKLIEAFQHVKKLSRPVLLHVMSTKGKGYAPAEDNPLAFHGLGQAKKPNMAPESNSKQVQNIPATPTTEKTIKLSYTDIFGSFIMKKAEENPLVVAVTAAMSQGTGLNDFFQRYPERSFDVGIAEQHAITFAAGLAAGGLRPVVAIYSTFLQRAFDQLYHDIALQKLPVLLAVDRAGLVGEDGATHQGNLDLSFLRLLPNFTIMAPKDEYELKAMLDFALSLPGPAAIRYPRGPVSGHIPEDCSLAIENGRGQTLSEGNDLTILAIGQTVWPSVEAANNLAKYGYKVGVINLRFIKPLDAELIQKTAIKCQRFLTVEENSLSGGLFGAVSELMSEEAVLVKGLGLPDQPVHHASQQQQRSLTGLDAEGITRSAIAFLKS